MDERKLLANIAEMYYLHGMNQQEIAEKCNISRSMISRHIARAMQLGIVEVIIHHPDRRVRELENRLRAIGFVDVRVAAREQSVFEMGAEYLQEQLHNGTVLGVSWGKAIFGIYKALRPRQKLPGLKVVQGFGSAMPNDEIDGTAIISGISSLFGGTAHYLHTPLHVESEEVRNSLLRDANIGSVIKLAEGADLFLTGIGAVTAQDDSEGTWLHYLDRKQRNNLRKRGAVGHLCTRHFDIDGNYLGSPADKGIIGISHKSLDAIPSRVGIAYGLEKTDAILGAVRGGCVNVLLTDEETAESVLARLE